MWTLFIVVLTIRQNAREWDNGKTGKGSRQQLKEMTIYTGKDNMS